MATINVLDAAGSTVALEKPLTPGRSAAATSRPVALSTEDKAALDLLHTDLAGTLTVAAHAVTGSGNFAGTVADGANVTLGAKADAKSSASDTTPITAMSVWKQLSFSLQALVTAFGAAWTRGAGNVDSNTQRVAIAADSAGVIATGSQASPSASYLSTVAAGDIAAAASDSGNPVKIGAKAVNAEPTALSNGQRANLISDLVGKQIVLPYANPENFVSGATASMTGTTSTSLLAAPAAGLRNYLTTLVVSNSHATIGTNILIQDGSGGTTLMVVPAAAVYGGAVINLPVALRQPTTATALFCQNETTGAAVKVSAVGYKGV